MSKKEREIREVKELAIIFIVAMLATAFVLGIEFGKQTAIRNCYLVTETETSYVLNFNGTEHLYLRDIGEN